MLKNLFKDKQISKTELSKKLNIKVQRVNNWILRNSIPPQFIRAVAKEIGVGVEEILEAIEKEKR